jgi:hypothetical protein
MNIRKILTLSLVVIGLLFLAGCEWDDLSTNFVGGGFIPSAEDPARKATFGFRFDGTVEPARIHGTYHDEAANVKLRFTGAIDFVFGEENPVPCMAAVLSYVPIGPEPSEEGQLDLVACDGGIEGVTDDDAISISITSGPFEGYQNEGELGGGNLKDLGD